MVRSVVTARLRRHQEERKEDGRCRGGESARARAAAALPPAGCRGGEKEREEGGGEWAVLALGAQEHAAP